MHLPSDHLLRILAAVPVSSRILDLGCGAGAHTEALLRLGFDVEACDVREEAVAATRERVISAVGSEETAPHVKLTPLDELGYAEASFDWIVAHTPIGYVTSPASLSDLLSMGRRLLRPGGWIYVAVSDADPFTPERLGTLAETADLAEASAPETAEEHGAALIRAIFRRVDADTPR